jgi:2-polyprenyl-3-methyl-5-hydroxy-6-metoxy-1,4-benzoquinol methylase
MKFLQCILCNQAQKIKVLFPANLGNSRNLDSYFSARRTPDRIHYQINKCLKCGLIFSSPILTAQKLSNLYKESSFNYNNLTNYINQTYIHYFDKYLFPYAKKSKILDIGCGDGFFLKDLERLGYQNTFGVEPSFKALKKTDKSLKSRIKTGMFKTGLFPPNTFDIITSFQTLDHIENPHEFIQNAKKSLKKKGAIFIIVHNTDGLSVKIFGEKSPIFDIEHIYLFNKKTLKKLLQINGFKNIKVFDIKNSYPLYYWLKMIPIPLILKTKLLKLITFLKLDKIVISLNAGNIGAVGFIV